MNLIVINLDKGIFKFGSASLERLKEYSRMVDKIFVIVWTNQKEQPIAFQNKLFIYPTSSCCRLFYYLDSFRLAKKILADTKIDLIFTQDPFETGLAGYLMSKKHKIPLQLQIHTDFLSPYFWQESFSNRIRVLLAKKLIKKADGFRVVSGRIKKSLIKLGIPEQKISVLPIFVDTEKFRMAPIKINLKQKYPQFDFIILMASRLSREKNIGLAIEAMREIIKKFPKTGLIIVGEGKERNYLQLKTKNYKLQTNVVFEPWTDDLASYYKSADLFLLTSNYEVFGLTVIEAAASACPVVMTDVGCAGEIIKNAESGMVFPVGDKDGLKTILEKLISDKKLRENLGRVAQQSISGLPSKDENFKLYKESWEKII